jgi:hypothetical protein
MQHITRIDFEPLIGWPWLAALAAAALLLTALAVQRRLPGAWWRTAALTIVLLALANPSVVQEQREPLQDTALAVIDHSLSQQVGDRAGRSRDALDRLRAYLKRDPSIALRVVEAGARAQEDGAFPDGTLLMTALDAALDDVPRDRLAGVVMITDGQVHDVAGRPGTADPAAPVHALLSGNRGERDRRLVVRTAPSYGIVGEALSLTAAIEDQSAEGGEGFITFRQDDGPLSSLRARPGQDLVIPFTLQHAGPTVIELETPTVANELTGRNNRTVVVVNGVRDRLRVLLVSGEPHAGERTWRNILKSDPSVDLVHFTILRPPHKQDGTPIRELSLIAFPTRELFQTRLKDFDLVIFDRYRRRGVLPDTYLANVADYVRGGGAVLVAAGPSFATPLSLDRTSLGRILPGRSTGEVHTTGFRPSVTDLGRRHPVTADLPGAGVDGETPAWGRWFRLIDMERRRGETLMQAPNARPLLVLDRIGEGRVAQLMSDHAWLWARGFEGGGPHAELLRRIAHWLMKEPDLEEEDLKTRIEGNRMIVMRRSLQTTSGTASVRMPSGRSVEVEMKETETGRAIGELQVEEPGLYRLRMDRQRAVAAVGDVNPMEYADMRTSAEPLKPIVEKTGGGIFWLADGMPDIRRVRPDRDAAGPAWMGLRANGRFVVTGIAQYPALPALAVMLLILGATFLAWRREGR